jgi:UDP-glucuronate 4-epimerase
VVSSDFSVLLKISLARISLGFEYPALIGQPIDVYNHGKMIRDFTFISDIVDGTVAAIDSDYAYEIFNLGCGNPVTLMDYIAALEEALNLKAEKNFMEMQPGDVVQTSADISKARSMLGYEPKVQISKGVKLFVEWYQTYYTNSS